jgi:hypothetical protein
MRSSAAMRLGLALASGCAVASQAHAAAPSLWAAWQAPNACPQEAAFVTQIEGFLGRALNRTGDRSLEIVGQVSESSARGYVAQLRIQTARGTQQRELVHRDCAELTEAAALVAALAIDPELVVPEKSARPEPAAELPAPERPSAPAAAPPPQPASAPVAVPSHSRRSDIAPPSQQRQPLQGSVTALGLVGSSVLPDIGVGVGGQAAFGAKHFRLAVRGTYWLSRFQPIAATNGSSMELGAWGVAVRACGLQSTGDITLSACLGPEAGDMSGAGDDVLINANTQHERWSALLADVSLSISASSGLTTLLGVELGKTLEAPRFGIRQDAEDVDVFQANAWIVNAFVGLGLFR